ncbi:MAG: hypothetical protein ACO26U_02895, partial [Burkholderiaceae bacterium]
FLAAGFLAAGFLAAGFLAAGFLAAVAMRNSLVDWKDQGNPPAIQGFRAGCERAIHRRKQQQPIAYANEFGGSCLARTIGAGTKKAPGQWAGRLERFRWRARRTGHDLDGPDRIGLCACSQAQTPPHPDRSGPGWQR